MRGEPVVEGRRIRVAGSVILALALVALLLAPIVAVAKVNITVEPDAPEPVKTGLAKALGLAALLAAASGVLAILWGGFKLATGQEGAGRWLVSGAIAIIIAFGINEIVAWLTTKP